MYANTRFRWCLKVASVSDSGKCCIMGMLPGSLYRDGLISEVGEDEIYELIQSYYSGAVYKPDLETSPR